MKEIGGYFELELPQGEEYHKDAIRLNTGRNAFEYVLRAKGYQKVYLPYYTCDVMLEPVKKLSLAFEFYHIDEAFRPIFDFNRIKTQEVFVYTNYFGICDIQVSEVAAKCKSLIVDNAQAFFSRPLPGVDTFYSPRKFFGLPDGGYLYTQNTITTKLDTDYSYLRFKHLLGRADKSAEEFYSAFKKNDADLGNSSVKIMSKLTHKILASINYEEVEKRRKANFNYLSQNLQKRNQLSLEHAESYTPMVYPFLIGNGNFLKKKLLKNRIFIATYWPNVTIWLDRNHHWEAYLQENLVAIPVDQRYTEEDIEEIVKLINKII